MVVERRKAGVEMGDDEQHECSWRCVRLLVVALACYAVW